MTTTTNSEAAVEIAAWLFFRLGPAPSLLGLLAHYAGEVKAPHPDNWPSLWHRERPSLNMYTEEPADEYAPTRPLGLT
ncbi:MAG: hypothetical protein Q9O62_00395 [Ardenticatenia bacterium]|nr:hypothetical protein [Ardenticatenia bacterium]